MQQGVIWGTIALATNAAVQQDSRKLSLKLPPHRHMENSIELEAAVFRRLLQHLDAHKDVQNIDLMSTAGFCRNCLADWYREAAEASGHAISKDQAREAIYGMPFADWKAMFQTEATPEQREAFAAAQKKRL